MRVLHLCAVALERVRHSPATERKLDLSEFRWAVFLGCYWLLDDWLSYLINDALEKASTDEQSQWDRILVEFLLTTLRIPINFASTDELKQAPCAWLQARSNSTEDVAALTLALEITWYKDCQAGEWRELANAWIGGCSPNTLLRREIERVVGRLSLQSSFCASAALPDKSQLPADIAFDQKALVEAWRLFHNADFSELDTLLRELAGRIRVDSPIYPALFRAIHFSRIGREASESQFLSLSRRQFVESRQPAQACQQLRDERYEAGYSKIARMGFPDGAATERFTCFRMAMLNQLHSLRTWDIGGWLQGEKQRAQALLELSARGDIRFARGGVVGLKNSLGIPKPGEYPHFDLSIRLLDALPENERCALTFDLIASPRIAWSAAHRVLSEMSDAIPSDALVEVARWYVQVELDTYHSRWTHTRMEFWGDLLHWTDNAAQLIDILKPALLVKAADYRCWDDLHGTLCSAIIKGETGTSQEILVALLGVNCEQQHFNASRYSVLHNVVRHRPELADTARGWMASYVDKRQDQYELFMFRHLDAPPEIPIDDAVFRDWVRAGALAVGERTLQEQSGTFTLGIINYHSLIFQLTWPESESELTHKLIAVVNADYVPFANKTDPVACLAMLALRLPANESKDIVSATMNWLDQGIAGKELGHTGPLSTGQMRGLGPDAIVSAFAFLTEVLADNNFILWETNWQDGSSAREFVVLLRWLIIRSRPHFTAQSGCGIQIPQRQSLLSELLKPLRARLSEPNPERL